MCEQIYYNSNGLVQTFTEIMKSESEKGNYSRTEFKDWARKYNIESYQKCIWVTPNKRQAISYQATSQDHDAILYDFSDNELKEYVESVGINNPYIIDNKFGFIIPESDDGDDGFIFVYTDFKNPIQLNETDMVSNIKDSELYIPLKQSSDFEDFISRLKKYDISEEEISNFCSSLNLPDATAFGTLDLDRLEIAFNKGKKFIGWDSERNATESVPQGGFSKELWLNSLIKKYSGKNSYIGANYKEFRSNILDKEIEDYFRYLGMTTDMIADFLTGNEGKWLAIAIKSGTDWKSFIKNTVLGFIDNFTHKTNRRYKNNITESFTKSIYWNDFIDTVGLSKSQVTTMVSYLGYNNLNDMIKAISPDKLVSKEVLDATRFVVPIFRKLSDTELADVLLDDKLINENMDDFEEIDDSLLSVKMVELIANTLMQLQMSESGNIDLFKMDIDRWYATKFETQEEQLASLKDIINDYEI